MVQHTQLVTSNLMSEDTELSRASKVRWEQEGTRLTDMRSRKINVWAIHVAYKVHALVSPIDPAS